MKNILFATSEAVPFIKTGGLADVAGSLPKYFDKRYFDIRVILPKYACMKQEWKDKMNYITHFYMDLGYKNCYVGIMHMEYEGIQFYFIDNEYYFSGPKPYDGGTWDLEKFAFFSKAVLSVLPVIGFRPDIIHCHDWQTGLVPVYLHDSFQQNEFFWNIKTIMTIHNLKADDFVNTGENSKKLTIDETGMKSDSDDIYNILLTIGIITAVIVGTILGVQFIIASAEEKAKVKEALVPYLIGCIVVFGAFSIWKVVLVALK